MTHHNQIVGGYGERLAGRHLLAQGMVLLERNWRVPAGEVDLIARDGTDLVFVEVKTRRSTRFGQPVEAVVPSKARRLRRLAAQWLATPGTGGAGYQRVRFDVVSVLLGPSTTVEHLRGAF
jgi:putative endonuclease